VPDIESSNYNFFLLPASTLRGVNDLLVNVEGKMKGRISKLNDTCKLLVGIVDVNFFGDKENCEEKYPSF
jgi:hypothetical protein